MGGWSHVPASGPPRLSLFRRRWQLVVDYRGLKKQTKFGSYTLPLIEDMLQRQNGRRLFTVIDLKHGYHQMPFAPESRACTAMSTPLGPL